MRMRKMKLRQSSQESEELSQLYELLKQQISELIRENERIKYLQYWLQQNEILTRIQDVNEENYQLKYNIVEQRMINKQAVEKLYNNETQINSIKKLSRAKNMEHIKNYVDDPEVQEFFFALNNAQIKTDSQYDMSQYFNSKAQAATYYHEMIEILEYNRRQELLRSVVWTLINQQQ
ncbi:Hypothetical_protein [Hexamita inflata]|uniref:Hypothetical_protein n=1 Tax=Hexamita inflata TaxID=28002 RepID=A0AA86PWF7_9EUKA|nr:Hypothetical protein HINF_LOCUS35164 [Hexamita inflata]